MIGKEPSSQNQITAQDSSRPPALESRHFGISRYAQHLIKISLICISLFATISISATQISLLLGLLGWIAYISSTPGKSRSHILISPIGWTYFFFLGTELLAVFFAQDKLSALNSFRSYWVVFAFFFAANWIKNPRELHFYLGILILASSLVSLIGVFQYIGGLKLWGYQLIYYKHQATGFHIYKNNGGSMTFAGLNLTVLLTVVPLVLFQNIRLKNLFWIFPFGLIALALLFSLQRSAWLGFLGGIIVLGFLMGKKNLFYIVTIIFLGAISIYQLDPGLWMRWTSITTIEQNPTSSSRNRILLWESAWQITKEHPLIGVGPGQFDKYAKPIVLPKTKPLIVNTSHAHSNPFQILATAGFLGFFAYIYLWIVIFREGFRILKRAPPGQSLFIIGVLSTVAGFHATGFFEYNFGDSEVITLVWFLLGAMMSINKWKLQSEDE